MVLPTFLLSLWAWLKKYWTWLLFPVGVIIYLIGRSQGGVRVVPDREESDAAQRLKEKVEAEKQEVLNEVARERAERSEAIIRGHQETIRSLTEAQKDEMSDLLRNPDELNEYLLRVGREIRG